MSQDLYDLPAGWEWKRLGDIVEFRNGFAFKSTDFSDIGIPILRISNIQNGNITEDRLVFYPEAMMHSDFNRYFVEDGEIVIAMSGATTGKVAINKSKKRWLQNQRVGRLVIACNSLKIYLYYFLSSVVKENLNKALGAAQPNLSTLQINAINIPLPPLTEQTRIVEKLDAVLSRIDTAIDELQQSLALVDAMFDSYLSSLSYETVKLGDLVNITTGRLDANAATDDGEFTFFTCSRETYRIDNYAFDCEAILLAGNNAVGDFNVKHFKGKFNAYQRTYVITVKDNNLLLYRFLYFQLFESMLKFKNKSIGSGTKFLKIGMIKDLDILLPNLTEQQKIVEKLDSLNEQTTQLKTEITAKIVMFNQLKASVLDGAFRGLIF
jgi:type I restriction enzyme S subunit